MVIPKICALVSNPGTQYLLVEMSSTWYINLPSRYCDILSNWYIAEKLDQAAINQLRRLAGRLRGQVVAIGEYVSHQDVKGCYSGHQGFGRIGPCQWKHISSYHQVRVVCNSRLLIFLANPGLRLPEEPKRQPGQDCWRRTEWGEGASLLHYGSELLTIYWR